MPSAGIASSFGAGYEFAPEERPVELQNERIDLDATRSMPNDDSASQLANILDQFLADLQAGRDPDRKKLLEEHPELATELKGCFSGIEFIHRASLPLPASGVPTQLGDFRIVQEVGRGGMGVVYEAEQISLKRRVALKVLRYGAAADTEAMQRFQREAETVAALHHTNIVPIFAIGSEHGVNYYAMQFIEGLSLSDELKGGGCALMKVADWGLQAADALAYAHAKGVVHRDIKPSNLILDPDGQLWLTDFGLAKRIDDVSLSLAGAVLGTPRYMSPEQASSIKHPVDHRTDLYSLGATLYELATGRPVFDADTAHGVITQILTAVPPAPRLVRPDLPRVFETIILKCLAKEPAQRYTTARALADDLRAFIEGRAIKARRATIAERTARWFKQQRRSVGIAATAVVATITLVVGSFIAWQTHHQAQLGYVTFDTQRESELRAEEAELLSLDDQTVIAPFTLPTKEPISVAAGAYRLRLTAPARLSHTYLLDIAPGAQIQHEVALTRETVGHAISLDSPSGTVIARDFKNAGQASPRLFVGPMNLNNPTMRCYSSDCSTTINPDGSHSQNVVPMWEADWKLESPDVVSFLKLPANRNDWWQFPAQLEVDAWLQMLSWFNPNWFRNGSPPRLMQPLRDLDGDHVDDLIWFASQPAQSDPRDFGPKPLTPKAAALVAASGKDGKPLWWFRSQDGAGNAGRLLGQPIWNGDAIVAVMRSTSGQDTWIEAVSPQTGESIWRHTPSTAALPGATLLSLTVIDSKSVVIAITGNQLLILDAATGELRMPTRDLSRITRAVQLVDLDNDDVPEALLTFADNQGMPEFVAYSMIRNETLWAAKVPMDSWQFEQTASKLPWPYVTDFEGDGLPEVILPCDGGNGVQAVMGCRVLDGASGKVRWERRFPVQNGHGTGFPRSLDQYVVGPDLNGDQQHELFVISVRSGRRPQNIGQIAASQFEQYSLYVDCLSGKNGQSLWWQRIPMGMSEHAAWTGQPEAPIWWHCDSDGWPYLVLPVDRHSDLDRSGTRTIYVLSISDGRIERMGDNLAFPILTDWDQDGLDDLAVFTTSNPVSGHRMSKQSNPALNTQSDASDRLTDRFVVLRGSPPEAFRRLGPVWAEAQDFDGDGLAELSHQYFNGVEYALQIASGQDGRIMSRWNVDWPETPKSFEIGDLQSFPPPLGDFDGDGLADLLMSRGSWFEGFDSQTLAATKKMPLLLQAISSRSGRRLWSGPYLPLPPEWIPKQDAHEQQVHLSKKATHQFRPTVATLVDLDGDGHHEVLQAFKLMSERERTTSDGSKNSWLQWFIVLVDSRDGVLRLVRTVYRVEYSVGSIADDEFCDCQPAH